MASPRILAKLVSTAANMSAGAVLSIRDPSRNPEPVPPIVREVLRLIAETVCVAARPEEPLIAQAEAHLVGLIERYGTMRLAMETLSSGGRRLPGISHEKAHAWSLVMMSSLAQVDSVLRRSPHLVLVVGKWVAAQGDTLEARLDSYQQWLDSPISNAEPGEPSAAATTELELAPSALSPPPVADEGATRLAQTLLEEKRAFEPGIAAKGPRLPAPVRAEAERLAEHAHPCLRCLGLIALGRFKDAESLLPTLRGVCDESDMWTLWGDRYYFDGRYEDAVESFRSARAARDCDATRRNLAAAFLRSTKPAVEVQVRAAIDLLTESIRTMKGPSRERAAMESMLGSAWLRHPGTDRDADLRRAIEHLEGAIALPDVSNDAPTWAGAHLELGSAWLALPSGKKLENVQRAITCFERAGQVWTRESDPERWAAVQNHLGQAWERLPAGERAMNLERAIGYFQAALEVKTHEADPIGWATLQNNLGIAWAQVPGGDHVASIHHAIECHQRALDVWSDLNRRSDWAATQNNLGIAWAMLPANGEEREKNLRRAIAAYKAALEVRTRAAFPMEWASTHNNLGSTYLHLAPSADGTNIKEAIACFERALEVRTRDAMPIDWAKTQGNLGNAWVKMPGDRVAHLNRAVECYNMALVVYTNSSHPHQHEHIAQKKAEALDALDEMQIMGKG
jgi:tetratricopeptide (TPR) repeat protein